MTPNELAAKAAADSAARTKRFDEEALLAAEAFAFGRFDSYYSAKVADIERRISSTIGARGESSWLADPASLGGTP